jgi:two-component system, OmpR family, sensor histidine kinase KdpD
VALLASARGAVDAVSRLVDDLRDLSLLHAGAVETYLRPVDLDEVMAASLDDLGPGGQHVMLGMAEDLPAVIADAALLTRILTSLLADVIARSPADLSPALTAVGLTGLVEIRITDQGLDQGEDPGSLALRLAGDLADAMGGTLRREPNPGGGRTVILTLPAAARHFPAGHVGDVGGGADEKDGTLVPTA